MTNDERASILRALRAYINASQAEVAQGGGISQRTLWEAEVGNACSERTWTQVCEYYAIRGLVLDFGEGVSIRTTIGAVSVSNRALVEQMRAQLNQLSARITD